jgi:hypothetical protein
MFHKKSLGIKDSPVTKALQIIYTCCTKYLMNDSDAVHQQKAATGVKHFTR